MAKRIIIESDYVFDPILNKITITRPLKLERLLLITNVSKSIILYNFSDASIGTATYLQDNTNPTNPSTVITLKINCSSMSSSDRLQIIVDEPNESFIPSPEFTDPVGKLRVSNPQSLMDTDFEYSTQGSKWESISLQMNYPTFFSRNTGGNSFDIVSLTGDGASPASTMTLVTNSPHGLTDGDVVNVQESLNVLAEGTFLVKVPTITTITYTAKGIVSGNILDGVLTAAYGGGIFDNAHIPGGSKGNFNSFAIVSDQGSPSVLTCVFTNPHGLFPGTPILLSAGSASTLTGSFLITNVSTPNSFSFTTTSQIFNPVVTTGVGIFTKPEGYVDHRPFDGGVILTTGNNVCGTQTLRQTRQYFRYQSGKGVSYSTGTKFTPTFDISTISASSTFIGSNTINISFLQDHNLQPGARVKIEGIETNGAYNPFNGIFTVQSVTNSNSIVVGKTFTQAISAIDQLPGGVNSFVTAYEWQGSATRSGMYDDQNGFYFEYDGKNIYACRRYSNKELFGKISVTQFSALVTGTDTRFRKQLTVGEMIVIRGQSYRITQINSDTSLNIAPAYRGPSAATCRYLKTQLEKIPQSQWNVDKFDGTGPSGYVLDISKMQMVYIDYSWYGAGSIRYGMRGTDGNIIYCHKSTQNNKNTSSYQRSGNLPARYETINEPLHSHVLVSGGTGISGSILYPQDTVMYIKGDISTWPASGYLRIADASNFEICQYTSVGAYSPSIQATAINLIRRAAQPLFYGGVQISLTGTAVQSNFVPDSTIPGGAGVSQVSVQTISQTCAPVLSHWGSSVIMDGGFNDDKAFIFTSGMQRYLAVGGSGSVSASISGRQLASSVATMTTTSAHGFSTGAAVVISGVYNVGSINYKQRTANVNTIQTLANHKMKVGETVVITGVDSTFNGTYTITSVPQLTTFTYAKVGTNVAYTAVAAGGVATGTSSVYNGTYTVDSLTSNTFSFARVFDDEAFTNVSPVGAATQTFGTTVIPRPLVSLRVAPSADNGLARNFGIRETANRMQLKLDSIGILSQGQFLIEGILNATSLNGVTIPTQWETNKVGSGSLAQTIYHDGTGTQGVNVGSPTNTVVGGDRIFAFYTENAGGTNYSVTTYDAKKVRDLGNSILNGNGSTENPCFPNGPDILTIVATNLGSSAANVIARISWTEAQA